MRTNLHEIHTNFAPILCKFHATAHEFMQISPLSTLSFVLTPGAPLHAPWPQATVCSGSCRVLISVSCDIGTAALGSEGAASWLEAVLLYGLRTFVQ